MDATRFEEARAAAARLVEHGVADLAPMNSVLRNDGVPPDWVDDIVNLSPEQRELLAQELDASEAQWAVAFRALLRA